MILVQLLIIVACVASSIGSAYLVAVSSVFAYTTTTIIFIALAYLFMGVAGYMLTKILKM